MSNPNLVRKVSDSPAGTTGEIDNSSVKSLSQEVVSSNKNYIINGNFDFWQRATGSPYSGTGGPISGYAWADRFLFSVQSTNNRANRAVNRSTDVPTVAESGFGSTYSMEYSQTSALTLVGTDYLIWCQQNVEGIFYRDLHGKDMTLSFWFKSTLAGQYPAAFTNNSANRSYVTLFTYDVANVWQKIYITLPTDSSGTWFFNNSTGLRIGLCGDSNGTYDAPSLNTWINGQYFTSSSGVQVQAQTNITMKIAQLQLSEGDIQPEIFSMAGRDYAEELRLCQRYFEKSYSLDVLPGAITNAGNVDFRITNSGVSQAVRVPIFYKVQKRSAATVTLYSNLTGTINKISVGNTDIAGTVGGLTSNGEWGATAEASASIAQMNNAHINAHFIADAEL